MHDAFVESATTDSDGGQVTGVMARAAGFYEESHDIPVIER